MVHILAEWHWSWTSLSAVDSYFTMHYRIYKRALHLRGSSTRRAREMVAVAAVRQRAPHT